MAKRTSKKALNKNWVFVSLAFALIVAIALWGRHYYLNERIVAMVGKHAIRIKHVRTKNAINQIYYPENHKDYGLDQLKRDYLPLAVLDNLGQSLTDDEVMNESHRIDRATLMPAKLQQIKDVFKGDNALYQQVYVAPLAARAKLRDRVFPTMAQLQKPIIEDAQKFLRDVQASGDLKKTAEQQKRHLVYIFVSSAKGLRMVANPSELDAKKKKNGEPNFIDQSPKSAEQIAIMNHLKQQESQMDSSQEQVTRNWLVNVVARTPIHHVYDSLMADNEGWYVMQRLQRPFNKKNPEALFVAVFFAKLRYDQWLQNISSEIKITP